MRVPNFIDSDDSTIIFWCVLCRQSRHLSGNACKMQDEQKVVRGVCLIDRVPLRMRFSDSCWSFISESSCLTRLFVDILPFLLFFDPERTTFFRKSFLSDSCHPSHFVLSEQKGHFNKIFSPNFSAFSPRGRTANIKAKSKLLAIFVA